MDSTMEINKHIQELNDKSREELLLNLQKYRSLIKQQEIDIDKKAQENYNAHREISVINSMTDAYEEEIEQILNLQKAKDDIKLTLEVQNLEDKKETMKKEHEDNVQALQQKITSVKADILIAQDKVNAQLSLATESARTSKENEELKLQIQVLGEEFQNIRGQDSLLNQKKELISEIDSVNIEIEQLNETIDYLKTELETCKESIEEFRGEMGILTAELESKSSIPLDSASRGNSMFVEVHDRKIQLDRKLPNLKSQYLQLQRECASLLKQIKVSQDKNNYLNQFWLHGSKITKEDEDHINYYKQFIAKLLAEIEEKKLVLKETALTIGVDAKITEENLKVMNNSFVDKERRIIDTLDHIMKHSKRRIELASVLQVTNQKLRDLRLKIIQLESEITSLKVDRDEICTGLNIKTSECNESWDLSNEPKTPAGTKIVDFKVLLSGGSSKVKR